ncbi:hypothetical protein RSOLAG1IB_07256 [Rhizoctonia solani AG-1 IB]|uniref:HTH CENPB-type domain-containing protein n=1 Tax=Thanatephorus cucumeris (strain AG1-IB / isolate 7/3/14) TaxID=1108050 RepID=A0A0B7FET3_THACB|nr:hypothetical protein RSOLAG1IB_07256 [Rhizoctonia solani AG-1 IB]
MIPVFREMGYATIVASTLSRLLREENAIRAYVVQNPQRLYEKRPPNLLLPEVDAAVSQWVIQTLRSPGAQLNGDMIREKAREFTHLLGYPNNILVFSNGWLERLKVRLGLSWHTFHGEASSAPVERLEDERFRLLAIIINYAPWDVYNVDEAALLFCFVPTSGLAFQKMPGVKLDKKFLTYVLCANMDGSDKRPPLIIGQAKQPRCFDKCSACEVDFYYFWNTKAWMVYSIWQHFLFDLNEDMRRQGRHILLLCDNAPSHKHNPANYSNIRIEFLAPNLTSWVQPMNGGIIASFKAQYKRRFARLALDRNNLGIANMYKIDQLQAMHMAADAWRAVVPQTIANCWRHVGLVPNHYALDNPLLPPPQPPTHWGPAGSGLHGVLSSRVPYCVCTADGVFLRICPRTNLRNAIVLYSVS